MIGMGPIICGFVVALMTVCIVLALVVDNAGVAIATLRELGCMKEYLSNAMERVYWPGRLQRISQGILSPDNLGFDAELFLDGGHNPSAGIAIANWIKELTPANFYLILGCGIGPKHNYLYNSVISELKVRNIFPLASKNAIIHIYFNLN